MIHSERFNLRLDKDTQKRLAGLSKQTGLSMSEIVRRLVAGAKLSELSKED